MPAEPTIDMAHALRFSVAPMMDWTDRHCRYFLRQISGHARLYTEMVTADAVLFGPKDRLLAFDPAEHPVALQLGGSDPERLANAARQGESAGYTEINLNVGCPSDRVQSGRFGACLMAEPDLVASCVSAMKQAVALPVTVKCRIGIDDQDSEAALSRFVEAQVRAGADGIIVHARKAWLQGLSPKQNREVPPLDYERVYRLRGEFPDLPLAINGGIQSLDDAERHLAHVDGVMLGRAAYHQPYLLADVDRRLFDPSAPVLSRADVVHRMLPYIEQELAKGMPLTAMTRHMLGLYHGRPGARLWRRALTEDARRPGADAETVSRACADVEEIAARSPDRRAA